MTREEKIICKIYLEDLDEYHTCNEYKLLMGLLEQEPCEDAISREAVLDLAYTIPDEYFGTREVVSAEKIKELPPVTPQPKTGHWILTDDDFVYCSECEDSYYPRPIDASWYYCPHCGAKMDEPQERSKE